MFFFHLSIIYCRVLSDYWHPDLGKVYQLVYQQRILPVVSHKLNIVQISVVRSRSLVSCFIRTIRSVALMDILYFCSYLAPFQEAYHSPLVIVKANFISKHQYQVYCYLYNIVLIRQSWIPSAFQSPTIYSELYFLMSSVN